MAAAFIALPWGSSPRADDFYEGKTIKFVVGFSAGGGFDTYTRMIARHISKHIPGKPGTIVENKTGAGSLLAANFLFNQADPDGLTIGNFIGPLVLQQAIGNKAARFDGRKFGWLGVPTPDSGVCVLTKASGIGSADEWKQSKKLIKLGGTAPGSTTDDVPRLLAVATGFPMQFVTGFRGTANVRLAAERGEVDGGCWAWESIKPTWAKSLDSGKVKPILQTMMKSHPDLEAVPLAIKYARGEEGKELLEIVDSVYGVTARPYSVPPGTPPERLAILQKAFMDVTNDPQLLAEAKKARLEFKPVDGPTVTKMFHRVYELKPETKAKIADIVLPKKQ